MAEVWLEPTSAAMPPLLDPDAEKLHPARSSPDHEHAKIRLAPASSGSHVEPSGDAQLP